MKWIWFIMMYIRWNVKNNFDKQYISPSPGYKTFCFFKVHLKDPLGSCISPGLTSGCFRYINPSTNASIHANENWYGDQLSYQLLSSFRLLSRYGDRRKGAAPAIKEKELLTVTVRVFSSFAPFRVPQQFAMTRVELLGWLGEGSTHEEVS